MDYLTLKQHVKWFSGLVDEKPLLIRAIDLPGRAFALRLKTKERRDNLVASLDNPGQGLRLTCECCEVDKNSAFVRTVNRLLVNGRLMSVSLAGNESEGCFDRVVKLHFAVVDSFFGHRTDYLIFCEFTGRISDVFICDADQTIIDRMSRTTNNLIGETYRLPDSAPLLSPFADNAEAIRQAFAAPHETWRDRVGAISPRLQKEIVYRSACENSLPENVFAQIVHESTISGRAFVYLNQQNKKLAAVSCFELKSMTDCEQMLFDSVNQAMNWIEESLVAARRLHESKSRVLTALRRGLKEREELFEQQRQLLDKYRNAEELQNKGNLLVANLYQIRPGSSCITLEDWETQSRSR
jgi:predicted ribosome quality control (RQC) complex YloA/Tae2 family protein